MSYTSFGYLFLFLPLVWVLWAVLPPARPPGGSAGGQSALLLDQLRPLPDLDAGGGCRHLADRFAAGPAGYFVRHHPAGTFPRRTQNLQKTADRRQTSGGWGRRSGSAGGLSLAEILALCGPQHCRPAGPDAGRPFADGAILCAAAGHQLCHADGGGVSGGCLPGQLPPGGHYWQVLSFLCFWPHVVEGPFDRWDSLSGPLLDPPRPSYKNLTFGVQRVVWGLFKKTVIADRANMYVKAVFDDYTQYSGLAVVVGTLLYTLQLYAEFSGCMDIVLGSAECFGIPLAENFRQPFFSRTVGEFWRRWHITLGAWLREYLFQPLILSGPWKSLGKFCRTRLGAAAGRSLPVWAALGVTWVAIGWWHGAGWLYLVYGLYYFFWQLLGEIFEPIFTARIPHLAELRSRRWYRLFQVLRTCLLVLGGMLIFRANGTKAAIAMFRSLAVPYAGSLLIQLDARDLAVLAVGAVLLLAVDLLHEKGIAIRQRLAAAPLVLRWAVYIAGVLAILIFGAYGDNYDPAGFIYAQF